jgi:hypothetical protein
MEENFNHTKVRILQYLKYKDISIRKFSEKISISPSNFNEKNMPSALSGDILSRILTTYEELNPDWLLLGKGEMLRSDAQITVSSSADSVPWSRYDAAQQEIGALRTRLEQSAESIARLLKENSELRKNLVSPSPATP